MSFSALLPNIFARCKYRKRLFLECVSDGLIPSPVVSLRLVFPILERGSRMSDELHVFFDMCIVPDVNHVFVVTDIRIF